MSQTLLRQINDHLLKQGLPIDYVKRTVGELNDHIIEASLDSEKVLSEQDLKNIIGEPEDLCHIIEHHFENRSPLYQFPFLSFIILPFFIYLISTIIPLITIALIISIFDLDTNKLFKGTDPIFTSTFNNIVLTYFPITVSSFFYLHHINKYFWDLKFVIMSLSAIYLIHIFSYTKITQPLAYHEMASVTFVMFSSPSNFTNAFIPLLFFTAFYLFRMRQKGNIQII